MMNHLLDFGAQGDSNGRHFSYWRRAKNVRSTAEERFVLNIRPICFPLRLNLDFKVYCFNHSFFELCNSGIFQIH